LNHIFIPLEVSSSFYECTRFELHQPVEAIDWTIAPDYVSHAVVTGIIGDRINIRFNVESEDHKDGEQDLEN